MASRVNPKWAEETRKKMAKAEVFTHTSTHKIIIQECILIAQSLGCAYKLVNLGAGVTTFTTDTDTCPCCKRKL